jgi:hypothetical protein
MLVEGEKSSVKTVGMWKNLVHKIMMQVTDCLRIQTLQF